MSLSNRDGAIDVALCAGPRLALFPTAGVRRLSKRLAMAGLTVGHYGGPDLRPRGVVRMEQDSLLIVQDVQNRIHRIKTRAVIRVVPRFDLPMPFPGWYSPDLIPESTARRLMAEGSLSWLPSVVILGVSNAAFQLGSDLLEKRFTKRVVLVDPGYGSPLDGAWEVERRRFARNGGRRVTGEPVHLARVERAGGGTDVELKVKDDQGVRVLTCARVISVGPFAERLGFREYPPGSLWYEFENTEIKEFIDDVDHHLLDEERADYLAHTLIRHLGAKPFDLQATRQQSLLRSRNSFGFEFEGKWLSPASLEKVQQFSGTPVIPVEPGKIKASIDCIESIGCRVCERACPAGAIQIKRDGAGGLGEFMSVDACTGCGICLNACPSRVPTMIESAPEDSSYTTMIFSYFGPDSLGVNDRVRLLSRRGDVLATTRIRGRFSDAIEPPLWRVEVPTHLVREVSGIAAIPSAVETTGVHDLYQEIGARVEVRIQGEQRRVRDGQNLSVALYELGMARANDTLMCADGACGLCQVEIDGVRKLACQSTVRQGMSVQFSKLKPPSSDLCPCEEVSVQYVEQWIQQHKPSTLESLIEQTSVMQGRCHGTLCSKNVALCFERMTGKDLDSFAYWMFPWSDWVIQG